MTWSETLIHSFATEQAQSLALALIALDLKMRWYAAVALRAVMYHSVKVLFKLRTCVGSLHFVRALFT
jgi:hypothetical protein